MFAQDDLAQYSTWMKAAVAARTAATAAITSGDTATAAAKAKDMASDFDNIAKFWKTKSKDDAVKFAETARDAAMEASTATSADAQKAALAKAAPTCAGCHALYRDGSKFKGM